MTDVIELLLGFIYLCGAHLGILENMFVKENRITDPVGQMSIVIKSQPDAKVCETLIQSARPDLAEVFSVGKGLNHRGLSAVALLHNGRVRTLPRFACIALLPSCSPRPHCWRGLVWRRSRGRNGCDPRLPRPTLVSSRPAPCPAGNH